MKRILLLIGISVVGMTSRGQGNEFHIYPNGLIYSDTTMARLKFIVDSLQLKFRGCDLSREYFSMRQGTAYYISLDTGDIRKALSDIRNEVSYRDFIQKYPMAKTGLPILITEEDDENAKHEKMLEYAGLGASEGRERSIRVLGENDSSEYSISGKKGNWVFDYTRPDTYSHEKLEAFYLLQSPASQKFTAKYARLILYTDCMVDTSTSIFFKDAKPEERGWLIDTPANCKAQQAFREYINNKTYTIFRKYHLKKPKNYYLLEDSLKHQFIEDSLSRKPEFRRLLARAVIEFDSLKNVTDDDLEYYTACYYAKSEALRMKRNRLVIGGCSMDQSPRLHAMNIALLAAQTANWSVFLKAHLDIMNDHFQRMSDGSYAWGRRKTYLKELEDLDIDVPDLLLGTSLRIVNPSDNHYFGSIRRLGRALAETKDRQLLEGKILAMIQDNELDNYNRLIQHYLFLNYIYYLPEKESRLSGLARLEQADNTLPDCVRSGIKINRESIVEGGY